jgi:diguanylate cyclase (GGDEF)-like protein
VARRSLSVVFMNGYHVPPVNTVKLTGAAQITGIPTESPDARRTLVAGLVLRTQAPSRMVAAVIISALQLIIAFRIGGRMSLETVLPSVTGVVGGYIAGQVIAHFPLWRNARASEERITAVLALDIAFVYLLTGATSAPMHFDRALFGMIVVVHVANHFFGGRQAWRAVQMGIGGYLALLYYASVTGLPVDVPGELWTLALCAAGISLIVRQAAGVRRRLRMLVTLFENVEDGDFTQTYNVAADKQPDEITRVGQAYNRVRAQLSSMILTDPLTGCLNRRGFDQSLAREVARSTRTAGAFGLIAVDLDHFKAINDTHGHLAGDALLREVGAILLASGRAGDVVARMGGEEFAILLPDAGNAGANLFAARLCERIRSHEFVLGAQGQRVSLTVSVGVAVGAPLGEPNFAALLWSRADSALYAAKRGGRDCVRAWMSETELSGEHAVIGTVPRRARTLLS